MQFHITHKPVLDPGFIPAVLWNREYRKMAVSASGSRDVAVALARDDGLTFVWKSRLLPDTPENRAVTIKYVERVVKFLLWIKGGHRIIVGGAPEIASALGSLYSEAGARSFDWDFIGRRIYDHPVSVESVGLSETPEERDSAIRLGRHLDGNRIGFDLGGSDRKSAAVVDGQVVFSEEIKWDPYFQSDPDYHLAGIRDTLQRAAAHLPGGKAQAIGGSAAGVYVNNQVRAGSLFRGIPPEIFETRVRGMFDQLAREWGVPFVVVNDGEVTALAGSMSLESNRVLGISMGTSLAAGYVNGSGEITPWLNELAFAPVDYRENAPQDEWSGDIGCGVQYFSQQGVARLAKAAGYDFGKMPFAEQLEHVQAQMKAGNENAARIYRTIGTCFGYSIAHYAEFYEIEKLLILGRVTSGEGGNIIIEVANRVLEDCFPEFASAITITTPDEKMKRHGQAVAAASLPAL